MSYTRTYRVTMLVKEKYEINAIVSAGNTRAAIKKFLMHLPDTSYELYSLIKNKNITFKKTYDHNGFKTYENGTSDIKFDIIQINPSSDFIFVSSHEIND